MSVLFSSSDKNRLFTKKNGEVKIEINEQRRINGMETRTGNDAGASFMAVALIKGSVPGVKGYPGILALFC